MNEQLKHNMEITLYIGTMLTIVSVIAIIAGTILLYLMKVKKQEPSCDNSCMPLPALDNSIKFDFDFPTDWDSRKSPKGI